MAVDGRFGLKCFLFFFVLFSKSIVRLPSFAFFTSILCVVSFFFGRSLLLSGETSQTATIAHYNNTIAESSYNARGRSVTKLPVSAPGRSALPNSSTNLNIGMDIWNTSHSATVNVKPNEVTAASAMMGRDGVMSEHQLVLLSSAFMIMRHIIYYAFSIASCKGFDYDFF